MSIEAKIIKLKFCALAALFSISIVPVIFSVQNLLRI